jgi:hypothetical protein
VAAPRLTIKWGLAIMAVAGAAIVANAVAGHDLDAGAYWSNWPMGLPRVFYGFTAGVVIEKAMQSTIMKAGRQAGR